MWFNPAEITKIAKPPLATLATSATYHAKGNAECSKVAEVAKVATTHDSKIAPLHEPSIELIAEMDKRSMRALAMLDRCTARRAVFNTVVGDDVILTVAIRELGTCELAIPKAKYDPWRLLELIERMDTDATQ